MHTARQLVATILALALLVGAVGCGAGDKPEDTPGLYPAYVVQDGKQLWGYINDQGSFVIKPAYEWAGDFSDLGLAVIELNDLYGVIDRAGKVVAEPSYGDIAVAPIDGTLIGRNGDNYRVLSGGGALPFTSDDPVTEFSCYLSPVSKAAGDTTLWGYVDLQGKVVIEPQYLDADDFVDDKAVVRVTDGTYAVIDTGGKVLVSLKAAWAGKQGDGLIAFRDGASGKYGYLTTSGEVAIPAQYDHVEPFNDGRAIAALRTDSGLRYGLIDRQGKNITAFDYASLRFLDGLYVAGWSGEDWVPDDLTRKALFTRDGNAVTDFLYYDIGPLSQGGRLSVSDFTSTYFIDVLTGKKLTDLPTLPGSGELRIFGDVVQAQIDGERMYLSKDGKTIWAPDNTRTLAGGITIKTEKYRPNRMILVRYPVVSGLDSAVQDAINAAIRQEFVGDGVSGDAAADPANFTETETVGFAVTQLGRLLIVNLDGYFYPVGAAHGMPIDSYYHFDTSTGKLYALADLFRKDSPYSERLQGLVQAQMTAEAASSEDEPRYFEGAVPEIRPDHPFTVAPDGLIVYFYPYEIAPYAAGFPTFTIPWTEIQDIVDTEGAFWKAFNEK
ncbi:MAG: WG repeat-containing protein [Chloroflexota bacterium]